MDNFIHASNTQIENAHAIFINETLDKLDKLADTLKYLIIIDAKYYVSNSATVNDAKGDPARNPKTVTHTSDGKGNITDTINGNLQQKLLRYRTLLVVVPTMEPNIDDRIAKILGAYQKILTPATKEVVADVVCDGVWVNWTLRQVIQTVRDGSTPFNTGMDVRSNPDPSLVLIGSPITPPACGISGRLQVGKKQQSNSLKKNRNA